MSQAEIQVGSVVYMKTTGEPVCVLGFKEENGVQMAMVVRPVQGRDGIHHKTEDVYMVELESGEARAKRDLDELELREKLFAEAKGKKEMSNRALPTQRYSQ